MLMIEITTLSNGAHRNQNGGNICPDGWAVIPDSIAIPSTFPFVNIEVDGQTVTSMTEGVMPEPDPVTPVEPDPITQTQLALAELAEVQADKLAEVNTKLAALDGAMTDLMTTVLPSLMSIN